MSPPAEERPPRERGSSESLESPVDAGPVVYIAKMFPRLSETFIVNEVAELRRRGVDLKVVSLLAPTGTVQSERARILAREVWVAPTLSSTAGRRRVWRDHAWICRRGTRRYLRNLILVALRRSVTAWKRFAQAGSVARFCLEHEASHVHAAFAHAPASVAFWVQRLTGIPYSFAAHAKDLYLSRPESIRHKLDAARFVWTCTEANGAHLRAMGSITPVFVGYHGADPGLFAPAGGTPEVEASAPLILYVGRLVPKKGLTDLLDAAALLARRGVSFRLRIVGDGIERTALENQAKELGLDDRVEFTGSRPPEHVREEYARAQLLVLPSVVLENGDRDGIPNVLVEAMSMGVPVVSTRVSAIPELVRDGETGLLVEARDPAALAGAMLEVLSNREAALARASRARLDVAARFDLHRNSERMAEVLRRHRGPTRCLYVCADLGVPLRGHKGASAHVRQVAARLAARGIEVRVLAANAGPEPPIGNAFELPAEIVAPPRWAEWLLAAARPGRAKEIAREIRRLALNLTMRRRGREIMREWRPDFVYERYALNATAAGDECRARGIPHLLEVNAPLADEEAAYRVLRLRRLTRARERRILRRADQVFVVSHALRRWALALGLHPDRVRVLPNGVDVRRFHDGIDGGAVRAELGWSDHEVIVAFAGSLKPWHGGRSLFDAFARAHATRPELRLLFIGDGPERKELAKRIQKHGLEGVVVSTRPMPQDRVPAYLPAAHIQVAPYLPQVDFYFSPLKVLEYLAVGRPVVASALGDIPDLVGPDCGRLVPPGDLAALAAALEELAGDERLRASLGRAAAKRGRLEDWDERVTRIVQAASTRSREVRLHARAPEPLAAGLESPGPPGGERADGGVHETGTPPAVRAPVIPFRVGYVLKMFPRFSETFIVNEVVELECQGVDVRVFSMKQPTGPRQADAERVRALVTVLPGAGAGSALRSAGAHLRCLRRNRHGWIRGLSFALGRRDGRALQKFLQAGVVADACARERIGHLHAHFASGPARVAKLASMIAGVPFSFTAHAKDLYWAGHRHEESHKLKKRVRLARFVVTVSHENQRFLHGLGFRVKEGRIRSIYIGLRLADFPFRLPSERPRSPRPLILGVGRLVEKKGFHVLLEALAILRRRGVNFRCVIAGDGPERERLGRQVAELGLNRHVRLPGAVPLARLRARYYSRARVLAQPCVVAPDGDRDGIPTVLLEAMALGVPVVSTRVSGIPEAMDHGVDGLLTLPGEALPLAEQIEALLSDPLLADRIARRGRTRVETQFDQRVNAGVLRKLFRRSLLGWPAPNAPEADGRDGTGPRAPGAAGHPMMAGSEPMSVNALALETRP